MGESNEALGTVAGWFAREVIVATLVAPSLQLIGGNQSMTTIQKTERAHAEIQAAVLWADAIIKACKQTPVT